MNPLLVDMESAGPTASANWMIPPHASTGTNPEAVPCTSRSPADKQFGCDNCGQQSTTLVPNEQDSQVTFLCNRCANSIEVTKCLDSPGANSGTEPKETVNFYLVLLLISFFCSRSAQKFCSSLHIKHWRKNKRTWNNFRMKKRTTKNRAVHQKTHLNQKVI